MLSIIIPSFKDPLLQKTIGDILEHCRGEIEVIVVLDGYVPATPLNKNPKVKVLSFQENQGMRAAINFGMAASSGEYVMKTDEHCAFDMGFDIKLLSQIEDNWIVTPRRYKLDTESWQVMDDPPIDYERLLTDRPDKIGGVHWSGRAIERKDILIDETMVFQGSCYMMSRKHWNFLGGLQQEGYGKFAQEAIEISLKTWLSGGRVMINKTTWYAHKHRKFGRSYRTNSPEIEAGNKYSMDFWLNNRWEKRTHDLEWLMKRFGLRLKKYGWDKPI